MPGGRIVADGPVPAARGSGIDARLVPVRASPAFPMTRRRTIVPVYPPIQRQPLAARGTTPRREERRSLVPQDDRTHRCSFDYDERGILRCRELPDHIVAPKAVPWWRETLLALYERGQLTGKALAEATELATRGRGSE